MSAALFRRQADGLRKLADLAADVRDRERLLRTAETFAKLAELKMRGPDVIDEGADHRRGSGSTEARNHSGRSGSCP